MALASQGITSQARVGAGYGGFDILTGYGAFSTTDTTGTLKLRGKKVLHASFTWGSDVAGDEVIDITTAQSNGVYLMTDATIALKRTGASPTSGGKFTFVAYVVGAGF